MNNIMIRIDNRKDILLLLLFTPSQAGIENEPISGRTRLMKLVYLFYKELASELPSFKQIIVQKQHHFKPYHFGPFSKDVFDDIQFLENTGYVEEETGGEPSMAELGESKLFYDEILIDSTDSEEVDEYYSEPIFRLSDKGVEFAKRLYDQLKLNERKKLHEFKTKFNCLQLATLLRYVYQTYPESAIESKIKPRASM